MRSQFFTAVLLLFAVASAAELQIYGGVNSGFMLYDGQEKFVSLDKFGGSVGISKEWFSFLSLGAEFNYLRGSTTDPIPNRLQDERIPEAYGGFSYRGTRFVKVTYYELWLRPKLILPLPIVKPYIAFPVSPLSMGGMRGYSVYGVGFGIVGGLSVGLDPFALFVESGSIVRGRKGTSDINNGPPWGMLDLTVPLNAGVSVTF